MPQQLSSRSELATLVANYDTFLFDCDGVLWNGDAVIDGVIDVLRLLRSKSAWSKSVRRIDG